MRRPHRFQKPVRSREHRTMTQEQDDLLKRLQQKHLSSSTPTAKRRNRLAELAIKIADAIGDFLGRHTKFVMIALAVLMTLLVGVFFLAKDFLTKRQNFPERNVLYRATNTIYISSGSEMKGTKSTDQLSEAQIYEGGQESKVGTYLFTTTREMRDDIEYFNMDNSQKIRIASATRKPEIVQAGLRLGGSLNFKEQYAQIITEPQQKTPQSYRVYKFVPERGMKEVEATIIEHADGTTTVENRMIEDREFVFGWFWGKEFRRGTKLEQFVHAPQTQKQLQQFEELIKILDSPHTVDLSARERAIREAMNLAQSIEATPIYATYEDGIFDLLPQESTIYFAHKPGIFERIKDGLLGASDHIRLRVNAKFDLFPGNYPGLNAIHFGKDNNQVFPFAKYNNGGYVITDKYGKLAEITIQDFWLFYGQDVLYSYYFDLNGDGKLDKQTELIGTVLCRTTHDDLVELQKIVGEGRPKTDVTFTSHYSFMAPTPNLERGKQLFEICGQLESMLPDQVNRGFGKHSLLGFINQQRSDIILFHDLTVENMSRALTQESTLVAKYDIVNLLIAGRRPYAEGVAKTFGLSEQFAGRFQASELLKERRDWSGLLGLTLLIATFVVGFVMLKPRKPATSKAA